MDEFGKDFTKMRLFEVKGPKLKTVRHNLIMRLFSFSFLSEGGRRAVHIALASRGFLFFLQVGLNLVIPDHVSRDAYINTYPKEMKHNLIDSFLQSFLLSGTHRWDGHHFTAIATNGYQTEDKLVFLPVFPFILKGMALMLNYSFCWFLNIQSCLLLSSIILNTFCFAIAAHSLHSLTSSLVSPNVAEDAVICFSFNPASIFFSAVYSESLYAALTLGGLDLLYREGICFFYRTVGATALFMVSSLTRSNGILNAGFLGFNLLRCLKQRQVNQSLVLIACIILSIIPFFWFQFDWIPRTFCPNLFDICDDPRVSFSPLGFLQGRTTPYSVLQAKYWDQGFLRFFRIKQLPNFALAFPMFGIVVYASLQFSYYLWIEVMKGKVSERSTKLIPFFLHTFLLASYAGLFTHVNVMTRMVCSSTPVLYWIVGGMEKNSFFQSLIRNYFTLFFFLGIALFCNGFPWT